MAEPLRLLFDSMLSDRLSGRGIDPRRLESARGRFAETHAEVERRRESGEFGFFSLPYADDVLRQVLDYADAVRGRFDAVVVLGIGGSALGTTTLFHALVPPFWNERSTEERHGLPRLYVLDNVDPTTIAPLLERLHPDRVLFNVVSKSGTTAETMAQFLIVRQWLEAALGERFHDHLVFTTDPDKGVLRRLARNEQVASFPIPPNVGGRFSVLSAVGLLPAALLGIDVRGLLAGARAMDERCRTTMLDDNPAGLFAVLQHLAHTVAGAPMHVLMAYSDRLYPAADWFRQLWAESLGKRLDRQGREVHRGPTPIKALGTTDQHSQVQLYMEGPFDKTITFLTLRSRSRDLPIPRLYEDVEDLAYLGGHSLGELLDAEQQATAQALTRAGRMNMTIELPTLDPHAVGQLFMMLQIATAYAGVLYDVDPLDQPGVELGKMLTYQRMGRPGYAEVTGAS